MTNEIDIAVITEFQHGDQAAFRVVYDAYFGFLYNVVFKMVLQQQEAEDIVQDVFLKIYKNRKKYNHSVKFSTWIYRISVNQTLNILRRKKLFSSKIIHFLKPRDESAPSYEEKLEQDTATKRLKKCIDKIPEKYRVCLVLKYMENLSIKDISEIMNIGEPLVKTRIHRAKQKLKEVYIEGDQDV